MITLRDKEHAIWQAYWVLLQKFSPVMNLTAWKHFDAMWRLGIEPSFAFADALPLNARVVDIGSGQGIPGLVMAALRPDCQVTLLEPRQKRAAFLRLASHTLAIQVRVEALKAQAAHGQYDVISSRAVTNAECLMQWSAHLAHDATVWIVHKPSITENLYPNDRIQYVVYPCEL